jgi:hypothetical protein
VGRLFVRAPLACFTAACGGAPRFDTEKTRDTEGVPHPGDKIHISLKTDESLRLARKVRPRKDMPRPGAAKQTNNKAPKRAR